jgi:diaminopimelate decarboxylase
MLQQAAYHPSQPAAAAASSGLPATVAHAAASIAGRDPDAASLDDRSIAGLRAERLRAALPAWAEVAYAVKANTCEPVVAALALEALAHHVAGERLRAGDVVVFPDAGSYGWAFALQQFLAHLPARRFVVDAASPQKEFT